MLDCMARILDPNFGAKFPKAVTTKPDIKPRPYEPGAGVGWMS
jgi:hypothetical protein